MKRMKIKIAGWIGILLWIMVLAQVVVTKGFEKDVSIMEAFSMGDQVTVKTCCSEIIGRTGTGINEANKVIGEIIDLNGNYKYEIADISESLGVSGVCKRAVVSDNDKTLTITMTGYDKSPNTYIHIKIEGKTENKEALNRIKEYCIGQNIEYADYNKICGTLNKMLTETECREYAEEIFEKMSAAMSIEHYDKDYIAYGYSAALPGNVKSGDKKVNIQIMISTNEIEEKSEIVIGTPILLE